MLTYEDFLPQRQIQGCAVSSAGDIAYTDRSTGIFSLFVHRAGADSPKQLTHWDNRAVRSMSWHPDGQSVFFIADEDGDERCHVYRVDVESGEITTITEGDRLSIMELTVGCSPDGTWLVYPADIPDPTHVRPWLYNIDTGEHRPLFDRPGYFMPRCWSPDGKYLGVVDFRTFDLSHTLIVEVATGEVVAETTHEDGLAVAVCPITPEDCVLLDSVGRQFTRLVRGNVAGDVSEELAAPDWDVEFAVAATSGTTVAWTINNDGYSELHTMEVGTGKQAAITDLPAGVIEQVAVSPDGQFVAVLHMSATSVPQVYRVQVADGSVEQITNNAVSGTLSTPLVAAETVRYSSTDDATIPAFVYKPTVPSPFGDGSYPVVVAFHGGPHFQDRPIYQPRHQFLLANGIGVVCPNVRGSTGYGLDHMKPVIANWGGVDCDDFSASYDYVAELDWVRADRVGVYGGSYGGFAVLTCMARLPHQWACGVDIVGPSNLVTLVESSQASWKDLSKRMVGDPETHYDSMMQRSPVTYADQVRAPLMVVQGANDPRVPQAESDQFVDRLRQNNIPVTYDIYEDEGHGFVRRENDIKATKRAVAFFKEHLLAE